MTTRMFLSLVDLVSMIEDRLAAFGPRISNLDGGCSMTLRPPRRGNPHSPVTPPSASRDSSWRIRANGASRSGRSLNPPLGPLLTKRRQLVHLMPADPLGVKEGI